MGRRYPVRAVGARYDGHPDLESVDLSIVGAWGEGAGSAELSEKTIRNTALALKAGGVGYYPRSNFVHVDTGKVRSW